MKFFKLLYDYGNDSEAIGCISREMYGIDQYDVEKGTFVDRWDSRIVLQYDPKDGDKETDYLANDLGWLIVSRRLRNLFEKEKVQGLQYLDIFIQNKNSQEYLDGYSVVNICNLVDALDLEHSQYDIFEVDKDEKFISVEKYALKKDMLQGQDLFKLKDDTIPKFISERLVKVMIENNVTGCDFLEVNIY